MGPKRVNRLKVAPTGRISIVPEVCETSEVPETSEVSQTSGTAASTVGRPRTRNKKKTPPTPRARSKTKGPVEVASETDDSEDQDVNECESNIYEYILKVLDIPVVVEIDYAMGTRVFGFRDLKNGKFIPKANYSFQIDAFCDGKRYNCLIHF